LANRALAFKQQQKEASLIASIRTEGINLQEQLTKFFQGREESLLNLQQQTTQKFETQRSQTAQEFETQRTQTAQLIQQLQTQEIRTESQQKMESKTNIIPFLLLGVFLLG